MLISERSQKPAGNSRRPRKRDELSYGGRILKICQYLAKWWSRLQWTSDWTMHYTTLHMCTSQQHSRDAMHVCTPTNLQVTTDIHDDLMAGDHKVQLTLNKNCTQCGQLIATDADAEAGGQRSFKSFAHQEKQPRSRTHTVEFSPSAPALTVCHAAISTHKPSDPVPQICPHGGWNAAIST